MVVEFDDKILQEVDAVFEVLLKEAEFVVRFPPNAVIYLLTPQVPDSLLLGPFFQPRI